MSHISAVMHVHMLIHHLTSSLSLSLSEQSELVWGQFEYSSLFLAFIEAVCHYQIRATHTHTHTHRAIL